MKKQASIQSFDENGFQKNIGALQRKIADWLNRRCKNFSAITLMVIFILFCAVTGLYLLSLILGILN